MKSKPPLFALTPNAKCPDSCVENKAASACKLTKNVVTPYWIEPYKVLRNITRKLPKMFKDHIKRRKK